MTKPRFPELPEAPRQPWVTTMTPSDRAEREELVAANESAIADRGVEILDELSDFAGVPPEAKRYFAERVARIVNLSFEEGVQVGLTLKEQEMQPQLDRHSMVLINRLGGIG
jgi:hypothetical protein